MGRTLSIATDGFWGGSGGGTTNTYTTPIVGVIEDTEVIGVIENTEIIGLVTENEEYEVTGEPGFPTRFNTWGSEL